MHSSVHRIGYYSRQHVRTKTQNTAICNPLITIPYFDKEQKKSYSTVSRKLFDIKFNIASSICTFSLSKSHYYFARQNTYRFTKKKFASVLLPHSLSFSTKINFEYNRKLHQQFQRSLTKQISTNESLSPLESVASTLSPSSTSPSTIVPITTSSTSLMNNNNLHPTETISSKEQTLSTPLPPPLSIYTNPSTARLQAARINHQGILHQELYMVIETTYISHYSVHVTYTNDVLAVNRWIRTHIPPNDNNTLTTNIRYIGLDCEWRANTRIGDENRVAVVQLATEKAVLVFHTSCSTVPIVSLLSSSTLQYALANENLVLKANPDDLPIPIEFTRILFDPTVIFVGVGVKNDFQKCIKDFKIDTLNIPLLFKRLQLPLSIFSHPPPPSTINNNNSIIVSSSSSSSFPILDRNFAEKRVVEMSEKYFADKRLKALEGGGIGLKSIGTTVLGISGWAAKAEKAHIHKQWELPLSLSQLRYAALDAWVSKVAYEVIETHGRRLPREEELARRHSKKLALALIPRILDLSILKAFESKVDSQLNTQQPMNPLEHNTIYTNTLLQAANQIPLSIYDKEYINYLQSPVDTITREQMVNPTNTTITTINTTNNNNNLSPLTEGYQKIFFIKARNLLINTVREGYNLLSLQGRIATAACALREDYSLAMRDTTIINIIENKLNWFLPGTLSSPPTGGSGHLRARRPFPTHRRLRRVGRPAPESRFEPDCHSYLQLSRLSDEKEYNPYSRYNKKYPVIKLQKQEEKKEEYTNEIYQYNIKSESVIIDPNNSIPVDSSNNNHATFTVNRRPHDKYSDQSLSTLFNNHWPLSGLLYAVNNVRRNISSSSSLPYSLPIIFTSLIIFPPVIPFTYVKLSSPDNLPIIQQQLPSNPHVRLIGLPQDYFVGSSTIGILTTELLYYEKLYLSLNLPPIVQLATASTSVLPSPTSKGQQQFMNNNDSTKGKITSTVSTVKSINHNGYTPVPTHAIIHHGKSSLQYLMDPML